MRTIVVGDEKNLAALRKRILDPGVTGSAARGSTRSCGPPTRISTWTS